MTLEVAIIGAGLFGCIIGRALRQRGMDVRIFDNDQKEAGSKPAACLMKPGWFSSLGREVYTPALALLEGLYEVKQLKFAMALAHVPVWWVSPKQVLAEPHEAGTIKGVTPWRGGWELDVVGGDSILASTVIVAAGIWTGQLVPSIQQQAQAGVAFLWSDRNLLKEPFIKPWAPYKQIVGFDRGDGTWVSDGSAILRKNWTPDRDALCLARCSATVSGARQPPQRLFGIRPYYKEKPCCFSEVSPGLWAATGGAKNGTLAAAWCAHMLQQTLAS